MLRLIALLLQWRYNFCNLTEKIFLKINYTFWDDQGQDIFLAIHNFYSKDSNVTIFSTGNAFSTTAMKEKTEKETKKRFGGKAQKYENPFQINVKDVGGRLGSL